MSIFYFTIAKINLVINNIKAIFYKSWCLKVNILYKIFIYIIKIFTIETYFILRINLDKLLSYFYRFIILKPKHYISNLDLDYLNIIIINNRKQLVKSYKKKFINFIQK